MNMEEKRRLRVAVCHLKQAQKELEYLGFHGVADHVRFCANDVNISKQRLDGLPEQKTIDYRNGRFVLVGGGDV